MVTCLDIAAFRFSIATPLPLEPPVPQPAYREFYRDAGEGTAALSVPLTLNIVEPEVPARARRVFDSGMSWKMFREGEIHHLLFDPPAFSSPLWQAVFPPDLARVEVRCCRGFVVGAPDGPRLTNPVSYPLDQILMMYLLSRHEGLIIHGAGIETSRGAVVFTGPSGAGKSTLCRLLADEPELRVLSDDRVVVRRVDGLFWAFGTPWPGEAGAALNRGRPLVGIYSLAQESGNRIVPISAAETLERILPVISIPWYDRRTSERILATCDTLLRDVPHARFGFVADGSARAHLKDSGLI